MIKGRIAGALLLSLCAAGTVGAAFNDDFSNEGVSNTQWVKSSDSVKIKFVSGTCEITNTDVKYAGMSYHTLPAPKPQTFTLSGKVTLKDTSMTAGFYCCLATSGSISGYSVEIVKNSHLLVYKFSKDGTAKEMLWKQFPYITSGANELKISKKESVFNIFCNGRFAGTFTDNEIASGDIALRVSTRTTAIFDDIVLTDTFETGAAATCFSDSFSSSTLLGWSAFGSEVASIIDDGALHLTTGTGADAYRFVDIPLTNFVLRTTVSHRGGSSSSLYGLFVMGDADNQVAGFGISGDSKWGTFIAGENITLTPVTSIRGDSYISSTGDTTYYVDTLEVVKREGVAGYFFIINGDTVTKYSGVNFPIIGAGLFCFDSLSVCYDDFFVGEGTGSACLGITSRSRAAFPGRVSSTLPIDTRLYNALGRVVPGSAFGAHRTIRGATGIYLQRGEKRAVIRLGK